MKSCVIKNTSASIWTNTYWVLLLTLFLCLSWGVGRYYYVGATHDDASYLLGATALRQGHYVALEHPGEPRLAPYPPGWPLCLALFVGVSEEPWFLLRGISVLFVILSCLLLRSLSRSIQGYLATVLFALHPITLAYATTLMSDIFFVFLTLLSFVIFERYLENPTRGRLLLLSLALGYASFTRTEGYLLIPSVCLGFCTLRRWRAALVTGVISSGIALGFPLWNVLNHVNPIGLYATIWKDSFYLLAQTRSMFSSLWDVLQIFLFRHFLSVPPKISLPTGVRVLLTLGLLALLSRGVSTWWKESLPRRGLGIAMVAYLTTMLILHGLWKVWEARYALPLIPLCALFIIEGSTQIMRPWNRKAKWLTAFFVMFCLLGGYADVYATFVHQASDRWSQGVGRPCLETYQWIKQTLSPSILSLYAKPAEFYLYTHRKAVAPIRAADAMQFRLAVLHDGITHVFIKPASLDASGHQSPQQDWDANQFWTENWPDAFHLIYQNPSEHTTLFEVRPSPIFDQAYNYYRLAQIALTEGHVDTAFDEYGNALRLDPTLVPVLVRYGDLALSTGLRFSVALRYLRNLPPSLSNQPALVSLRARINDRIHQVKTQSNKP